MSSKRKTLGFEDESGSDQSGGSEEEKVFATVKTSLKRVKLPKLTFITKDTNNNDNNNETNDTNETQGKTTSSVDIHDKDDNHTSADQGETASTDDYLNMSIQEDEHSKPQRLLPQRNEDGQFLKIHLNPDINSKLNTSLFGQIKENIKDDDNSSTDILKPLINTPLKKSKGLSMMEKMGFRVGDVLGKDNKNSTALLEPIISLPRVDKTGIGGYKAPVEKVEDSKGLTNESIQGYRERLHNFNTESQKERNFYKMQKYGYIFSGDADCDVKKLNPLDVNILWRSYVIYIQQRLKEKTQNVQVEEDLTEKSEDDEDDDEEEGIDEELALFNELSLSQRILRLNLHLRSEYNYCFYCGVKYEDQSDLFENCPGSTEKDHE